MIIADKLKHARQSLEMSLRSVREITGVGESSLSEFENGKREPSLLQLQKLAEAYGRSASYFLDDSPIEEEKVLWRAKPSTNASAIEAQFLTLCRQYNNLETWLDQRISSSLPVVPAVGRPSHPSRCP